MTALENLRKPLVVAVRGVAVGIGATLLGHADLVLLAESARLRTPFAALGLCPEAGSTVTFPALIGPQRSAELFFTGRWLTAPEAVAAGLGLRVVPDETVLTEARDLARQVAAQPLASLLATKELLGATRRDAARQARRLEDLLFAELRRGPDHQRAIESFTARGGAR
jgi:enoyl-CoA hydratase/carnithine racemase